jgi:hypothetical protein
MKILSSILLLIVLSPIFSSCAEVIFPKKTPNQHSQTPGEIQYNNTEETLKVEDFFPFEKNIYKSFAGEGNEYAEFQTYVDYLTDDLIQIRNVNPGTESVSVYQMDQEGLKRVFFIGETYNVFDYTKFRNKNEYVIKYPIEVGHSWFNDDGTILKITAIDKEIHLPNGPLKVLEITNQGEFSTIKNYYAKGIGHVKTEFTTKDDISYTVISELKSIESGVPFSKILTLYFPDFKKDEIVYLSKPIRIYTNTKIEDIFQDALKDVPPNSNLTPLLSSKTRILRISYDIETRIVVIDFSKDLIEELNSGASLESMIITSIANTLGSYFQTDKISITVEGDSYESGHIKLDKEDFIQLEPINFKEFSSFP